MSHDDPQPIRDARDALTALRSAVTDAMYALEVARDALRAGRRTKTAAEVQALEDSFQFLQQEYRDTRMNEGIAYKALWDLIGNSWLATPVQGDPSAAQQDISRLLVSLPITMLPVRLETRFDGNFLKIRISPDEIFANTHETALTPEEADAGLAYHIQLNNGAPEPPLWRDLIARFGAPRSAYILRVTGFESEGDAQLEPQLRPSTWTRPGTVTLPDRFAVYVYKNNQRRGPFYGNPIPEPLHITPDPKIHPDELVSTVGGQMIDPRIEWAVNFDGANDRPFGSAVKVGMGIVVPLQGDEGTTGVDRVLVVGVKTTTGPSSDSIRLGDLFQAHRFTSTMAFVPQGTPTNNTEGRPTSYPLKENAGEKSFVIERQFTPLPTPNDGTLFNRAVNSGAGRIEGFGNQQLENARAMRIALWPATLGYFLQRMMSNEDGGSIFTSDQIHATKTYFASWVSARGIAPAFRVGGIPYGVLPIGSLAHWAERSYLLAPENQIAWNTLEGKLLNPLRIAFDLWRESAAGVRRIQPGANNPEVDVARVLSTQASAREYRVRRAIGVDVQGLFFQLFSMDFSEMLDAWDAASIDNFNFWGPFDWKPRIGRTFFLRDQLTYTGEVVAPELSETAGLNPNFIQGIWETTSIEALVTENFNGKPSAENLLYKMLRHSTLTEYARAYEASRPPPTTPFLEWIHEVFGIPSQGNGPPPSLPQLYQAYPSRDAIPDPTSPGFPDGQVRAHVDALERLKDLPTAELDRLFGETLDLVSHRIDAWITALAHRRLHAMRNGSTPSVVHLGAYGWVEDVKPAAPSLVTIPGLGDVPEQAHTGGFIQAPSMTHASAAAVLRSGHMSMKNENGTMSAGAYAVDLSSERVRMARRLFEGVRNGQPLGALLGYEFERGLHERHPGVPDLDTIRFTFRKLYPLVANKSGTDGTEPAESIAARNVVDGSVLLLKRSAIPWGTQGLPFAPTDNRRLAIEAELDRLVEMFDATADLMTAEGVFQLVSGNIEAAAPTINNVVEGLQPPESIITKSARGGVGIAHRVALVFPNNAVPVLPGGWPQDPTPRATAEMVLNGWLGQLIGDPSLVTATITYRNEAGDIITSTPPGGSAQTSVTVTLAELGIHPLDVLAIAEAFVQTTGGSMLDRRLVAVALADPNRAPDTPPARFEVAYGVSSGRSFPEIFEVLGAAGSILRASRPLALGDLLPADEIDEGVEATASTPGAIGNAQGLYARAVAASTELQATLNFGGTAKDFLILAARFLPLSAFPDPFASAAALQAAAAAAVNELTARLAALPPPVDPNNSTYEALIATATLTLKAVFGEGFVALPFLPTPNTDELTRSLEARDTLLAADGDAPDRYLQQVMRSREPLGRFRKFNLYARAAGLTRPRVDVVQLPHQPGERWLGLPFANPDETPEESRLALLLLSYTSGLDPTDSWAGIVLDDWTEIIPNRREDTGIAVNYQGPRAKAPQCVLAAVPSGNGANWVWEELVASVEQALDLAKIRCVDRDLLEHAQIIPATVFATNENPINTVSTPVGAVAQAAADAVDLVE
jgi:hypothetical protein